VLIKLGTSMYHLTIDWAKPILAFHQSPSCHIPSLNLGLHGINQNITKHGIHRKPPPPSFHFRYKTFSTKVQKLKFYHKEPKSR